MWTQGEDENGGDLAVDASDGQARSALQKLALCLYGRVLRVPGCTTPLQVSLDDSMFPWSSDPGLPHQDPSGPGWRLP